VDELVKKKKEADDKLDVVKKELTDAKYVTEEQKDEVKGLKDAVKDALGKKEADDKLAKVGKKLADADIKEDDPLKGVDQLVSARNDLSTTLGEVAKKLVEAKFLADAKAPKEQLLDAVNKTIQATYSPLVSALARMGAELGGVGDAGTGAARAVDLTGRLAASQAELARLKILQGDSRYPEDMLVLWLPLLQGASAPQVLEQAAKDVQRVSKDTGASEDSRALAKCVLSLILWNQGKIADARTALQESLKMGDSNKGEWRAFARKTLKELSDPNAYYLPKSEEMYVAGRLQVALDLINSGLVVFPKDGRLLALRSLARLDQARRDAQGARLTAKDPGVEEARQDAEAAIAAGAIADGNYAAGRVAEELGLWAKAEQSYRASLKAHSARDQVGNRYRLALARVLLQRGPAPAEEPIPAPANRRTSHLPRTTDPQKLVQEHKALAILMMLLTTGLQVEGDDQAEAPNVDEALRLAEIAIANKQYEGHLIKAQALAKKGNYTQALEEYVKGLNFLIQPEYAAGLKSLVDNHPAFKRPEGLNPPDPAQAEKYFAAGLRLYYAGQYPEAEKQFLEAVRYHNQDARYLYFLGLSRLPQGKQSFAIEDFRTGAQLERLNRPGPATVSLSLERVQGPTRQTLNRYRP
jgi:tetratricopeptide (TPR) repeat protein